MTKRREFSKPVAREINARATRPDGQRSCEVCGAIGIPLEIHHVDMDAMQVDKSRKLTAADGKLLCVPCHDAETAKQIPALAKAIRVSDRHTGVVRSAGAIAQRGFAPSQRSADRAQREPKTQLRRRTMFVDEETSSGSAT